MTSLAPTLEAYFTDRLIRQRRVSPHTIASYRDTFRLLLAHVHRATGTPPSKLQIIDLDAARIGAFLQHLEQERGNTARTRNIRLAAIHSFFGYCALRHPEHAALIQRVLAIPPKRATKRTVTFLTPAEVQALLDAPDGMTWAGRRDHALLLTAVQTGLRVSELLGLTRSDTQLGPGAHVRTTGKGRKERVAPLTKQTVAVLRVWLRETTDQPGSPLFPSRDGGTLTRDALERRLAQHVKTAQQACVSLRSKRVTMHTMRHTAAMNLLAAGVDTSTIALWLGHEQERTTHIYLHADLELKQRTLDRITPPDGRPGRYRAPDTLLAFLEAL
jgi:site-specific recombinase XerD